jgi:Leucine-rich repeat (LRR) protein
MNKSSLLVLGILMVSANAFGQDSGDVSSAMPTQSDDYIALNGILMECGINAARISEVSKMENGRVVYLDLSNTEVSLDGIKVLPSSIGALSELRTLIARDNVFKSIPDEIFRLTQLRTLILASNKIEVIPPEIGNLENLDSLDLRHNRIESLPGEIGKLKKLTYVQLWGNRLTALPSSIVQLPRLKDLHVKDNRLESLPEGILSMKSLTYIDFQGNKLCKVSPKMEAWLKGKDKQYRAVQKCW